MSTTVAPAVPIPVAAPPEDETFTIPGLSWGQYVAISDALGDQPNLRTLFLDGSLTLVSPSFVHEWAEDALDAILLAVAVGCDVEMVALGSTTLRKGVGTAGLEGDRAYYLGDNVARVGRPETIDLDIHPPPDLAIEVENSHGASRSLGIYSRLGVPEVWRYDVRRRTLAFLALQPDGSYRATSPSPNLPFLTPEDVLQQLERAEEMKSRTRWFRQLADWVRDEIRPRLEAR